jgi:hypothetical protein
MKKSTLVFSVVFVVVLLAVGIRITSLGDSKENDEVTYDLKFYSETIQLHNGMGNDVDVKVTVSYDSSTYSVIEDNNKFQVAMIDASTYTAITAKNPMTWIPELITLRFDTKLETYVVVVFGLAQNSLGVEGSVSNMYIIDNKYQVLPYPQDNKSK